MSGAEILELVISGIVLLCIAGIVLGAYAIWFIFSIILELKQDEQQYKTRRSDG